MFILQIFNLLVGPLLWWRLKYVIDNMTTFIPGGGGDSTGITGECETTYL